MAHLLSTGIYFAIILGIMVLVHEFGHFAVAKLCGVRVEAFAIGFGKRLFGVVRGGTDYRLNLLPFGGYVKMSGELPGEDPTGDPGDFSSHPRWQRICIALAGPFANFILALVIMTGVSMFHNEIDEYLQGAAEIDYVTQSSPAAKTGLAKGDIIIHFAKVDAPSWQDILVQSMLNLGRDVPVSFTHEGHTTAAKLHVPSVSDPNNFDFELLGVVPRMQEGPVIAADLPDATSPAAKAGLKPGDKLSAIDGLHFYSVPALLSYLKDQGGKPATLQIDRSGELHTLSIQPEVGTVSDGTKQYRLGFVATRPPQKIGRLPFAKAVGESWRFNVKSSLLIVDVLKGMFTRHVSVRSLSGPIGIAQQVGMASSMGIWTVLSLMASISLNLGIFNLLPIPILDGGMILFLLIESVMRRDLKPQLKERIYQTAFVFLLIFATLVIFNDITKLPFLHPKS